MSSIDSVTTFQTTGKIYSHLVPRRRRRRCWL